jgi:hypothetical protein
MSKARNLANLLADGAVGAGELASTLDLSSKTLTLPAGTALPSQSGQNGNFLTTDGTSASWGAVDTSAAGNDTELQYNNAGARAGASGLVTDGSNLTIKTQGDLRFGDSDDSNYVGFQAPATIDANKVWTLPAADGTNGQVLSTNGSGTLSWSSGAAPAAAGSDTQVQFNSSGALSASSNLTFNGTGISTGNVNVTSTTAPATGMYRLNTASSGLTLQNAGASGATQTAVQVYYGRGTIGATTNGVGNGDQQFFGFGTGVAPRLTMGTNAALYTFGGHGFLWTDVPYIVKIETGGRGDNTGYNVPERNGHLYIPMGTAAGGNASNGRNGILVEVERQGLGDATSNGIKVWNRNFGSPSKSFIAQLKPDDPNGGGNPVGFYAVIDNSNGGASDNSSPIGLRIDHGPTNNYTLSNGLCAQFNDLRSGSTSRSTISFCRNTVGNQVGSITTTNTATAYNTSSDYRLKENVLPMTGALAKVTQLKPCTFTWKVDGSTGEGFIAHELQTVIPQAVTGDKDEVEEVKDGEGNVIDTKPKHQSVDTSFLVATLTSAIQELKGIIDTQASTITALEARVAALESGA